MSGNQYYINKCSLCVSVTFRRVENFLSKYFSTLFLPPGTTPNNFSRYNSFQAAPASRREYEQLCVFLPRQKSPRKKIIKPKPNKAQKKSEPDNSDPDQARSPMWGKFYPLSFHKVNVPSVVVSLPK